MDMTMNASFAQMVPQSRVRVYHRDEITADPTQTTTKTRTANGLRAHEDIERTMAEHADTVMRVCAIYLREPADRDDAFQETFLRYARYGRTFNGGEHRKAWLIRVASNICKDQLKSAAARTESLDAMGEEGFTPVGDDGEEGQRSLERSDVLRALRGIDERYAIVLYLKFYEGYTAAQIGKLLGMPENTVYTNISRGKQQLKGVLGHE